MAMEGDVVPRTSVRTEVPCQSDEGSKAVAMLWPEVADYCGVRALCWKQSQSLNKQSRLRIWTSAIRVYSLAAQWQLYLCLPKNVASRVLPIKWLAQDKQRSSQDKDANISIHLHMLPMIRCLYKRSWRILANVEIQLLPSQ